MNEFDRIELMAALAKQSAMLYDDYYNEIKFISADCAGLNVPAVSVRGIHNLAKLLGIKPTIEYFNANSKACRLVIMHDGVKFYEYFENSKELPNDV